MNGEEKNRTEREKRLADALRQNLRRRKAQARARTAHGDPDREPDAPPPGDDIEDAKG